MSMATLPLTVRNLTSTKICVQRFEIHSQRHSRKEVGHWHGVTRSVTAHFTGSAYNSLQCRTSQETLQDISPHGGYSKLSVMVADSSHEALYMFLRIDDQDFLIDIPHITKHTQSLVASDLNTGPKVKHLSIYHPQHRHILILPHQDPSSWMRPLKDDLPLSALSIPGTHNSHACHRALPSVRCQAVSVLKQLEQGIRFLDIRVQPKHASSSHEDLLLVHGAFSVSLSRFPLFFRPLVRQILDFLTRNPSETVILSLKREGTGSSTDALLSRILREHYANDDRYWYTAPRVPFLGEARGKIVLLRRFDLDDNLRSQEWGGAGWGIDAAVWADNSPHSLCPSGQVCIQDFYQVAEPKTIEEKIRYSIEHLKRAAEREQVGGVGSSSSGSSLAGFPESKGVDLLEMPFYINFLTASNLWRTGCWPEKIAARLNPAILEYLCMEHDAHQGQGLESPDEGGRDRESRSTGIVVCDFVGHHGNWDIVRCIIGTNARLEKS